MMNPRSPITTHVLDLSLGQAAQGVPVQLERSDGKGGWMVLKSATTNSDGRVEDLMARGSRAQAGVYRLTFNIQAYFLERGVATFYPEAAIVFEITQPAEHHHVPLLLSPFGYSTYRGT
ncbi:MAG: hydroxyisourate hydrolase [Oligoflexia bacterium]